MLPLFVVIPTVNSAMMDTGQTCEKEVLFDVDKICETTGSDIWEHWSNGISGSVDRIILRRYGPPHAR